MLDLHFDDFIEIPARLERMERKLDTLIGRRRESKTKLCLAPIMANWPQERYIPKAALGGFARLPVPMIAASQCMAAGRISLLGGSAVLRPRDRALNGGQRSTRGACERR